MPPSKREVPSEREAEGVIPPSLRATPLKAYGVKGGKYSFSHSVTAPSEREPFFVIQSGGRSQ